jgi:hypothetical protein
MSRLSATPGAMATVGPDRGGAPAPTYNGLTHPPHPANPTSNRDRNGPRKSTSSAAGFTETSRWRHRGNHRPGTRLSRILSKKDQS